MTSQFRTLAVSVVAGAATLAAASHIHLQTLQAETGTTTLYDTAVERCIAKGVGQFSDRGQWPRTSAGEGARALVNARCAIDVWAFGADASEAVEQ